MAHAYLQPDWDAAVTGDELVVTGDEARHAVKVARMREGEQIILLNGRGARVEAEVVATSTGEFRVRALEDAVVERVASPRLVLVQGLAKGGRDEMALQAAVELGVDAVVPWQASRSVSKWVGDKALKNRERWETIAREASKQSIRARVPEIAAVATSKQLAAQFEPGRVLVLDPGGELPLGEVPLDDLGDGDALTLIVGPEGGVSDEEIELFRSSGAVAVRLGQNVLRTSTAGPAAIAALLTRLSRW
ncbi:16S rRNA (uracil(1498)-N(3))-methyltransferase [Gulosibacter molinativorax]|uniref:Ribosomal RNA small subunit methyltransferase E n=1 Tax=Gulosibacter molinativorax TaxID=256821 RepID=A0ABT7C4Y0_9MICO|nr:16S rRNA (uracil(1498)-N(3))-methyltransferase [Gulosibacter molinativorax]MDJ1369824.1 16S rRNA (uracil(1498)-N(3))-methyltransferase [Gulosibacter molinativorax]QUY61789.1 Ribosomal RNA small subunit methyltransferase E [Gulosibacter molinativorax]